MQSLISVIIPIYRVEDYLDRCVASVCKQTYKNLEIILVDDGSDDSCPQICDNWAEKDSRIQVIHKQNGGLSDARNAGLKVATGEYVYFLDSDDYIVEHALERVVSVREEEKADCVIYGRVKIDEEEKELGASLYEDGVYPLETEQQKLEFLYRKLLQCRIGWEAWNRIYRMDVIRDNQLKFEPNKEIFAEDCCFNLYYTLCAKKIVCIPDHLHYYLIRKTSIMGQQKEVKVNEFIQLAKKGYEKAEALKLNYVMQHYDYIKLCMIAHAIFQMKPEEYAHYANKVIDKQYCKDCYNDLTSQIVFRKIWGIRGGVDKRKKYKAFVKLLG